MWTLTYNGTEKTLADWGITNLQRTRRSQQTGQITFTIPGNAFSALPFTHRSAITVRRDRAQAGSSFSGGTIWFYGVVINQAAAASGTNERLSITVLDPFWHLENLVYAQRFNVFTGWGGQPGEDPQFTESKTTHLTLNQDDDGSIIGTRAQIADALDYAISLGAPIQFNSATFPDMKIPLREEKDITCAEVIRRELAYMDAVTWFDYTTTPPTLNIKRRSDCTAVSRSAVGLQGLTLRPRPDLQVPFVQLKFEKTYNDSGGSFLQIVEQIYPNPLPADKFGGLIATVVLSPTNAQTLLQDVETAALDAESLDFWRTVKPELNDATQYADLAIYGNASVKDADGNTVTLPRYVVAGAIATWMDVDAVPVTVSVEVSYTVKAQLGSTETTIFKTRRQTLKARVLATDATTGTYRQTTVLDAGEDPGEFAGLAQTIYNDLNTLSWDGGFSLVGEEVPTEFNLGNTVNLTGGAPAWASMNALIQAITDDGATATTSVELGVNTHLSAGQLVDLLRINRTRNVGAFNLRSGSTNEARLPGDLAAMNTTEASRLDSEHTVAGQDLANGQPTVKATTGTSVGDAQLQIYRLLDTGTIDAGVGQILMELSRVKGQTIRLREVLAGPNCDKYCLVLCSETYDTKLFPSETAIGE
jgi:hypothetical protein